MGITSLCSIFCSSSVLTKDGTYSKLAGCEHYPFVTNGACDRKKCANNVLIRSLNGFRVVGKDAMHHKERRELRCMAWRRTRLLPALQFRRLQLDVLLNLIERANNSFCKSAVRGLASTRKKNTLANGSRIIHSRKNLTKLV